MNTVIFGAGNVGKGFIGLEMFLRGYDVTFVDIDGETINELKSKGSYSVSFIGGNTKKFVKIKDAIHISQESAIIKALNNSEVILTSVGSNNLHNLAGLIGRGIQNNREQIIIACENAPNNTGQLYEAIKKSIPNPEMYARFPNCVIDRICIRKGNDIVVEPYFEWIVETNSNLLVDIEKTNNLEPFFTRKLFLLNGSHSIIGYMGTHRSIKFVHEALEDSEIRRVLGGSLVEGSSGLSHKYGFDGTELKSYVDNILNRFSNLELMDRVERLVRDPIRKLQRSERLIGPMILAKESGLFPHNLCEAVAYVFMYDGDNQGRELQLRIKEMGLEKTLVKFSDLRNEDLIEEISKKYYAIIPR